jgi:two-component system, OmpR family, response regulator
VTSSREIRLPATAEEMDELVERLGARRAVEPPMPQLDPGGILRFRGWCVSLSPIEERLARALVDEPGSIVSRSRLVSDASVNRAVRLASLRTGITRLRHRIEPLGLTVRSVRGQGYMIEPARDATSVFPVGTVAAVPRTAAR